MNNKKNNLHWELYGGGPATSFCTILISFFYFLFYAYAEPVRQIIKYIIIIIIMFN